jgi:hypothetical protein
MLLLYVTEIMKPDARRSRSSAVAQNKESEGRRDRHVTYKFIYVGGKRREKSKELQSTV